MRKSFKREQIALLVRNSIELYLTENLDTFGFSRVVDVNMSEDLKTAYVYIACPVEKNEKKLENIITAENSKVVEIFKQNFTSKFIPKLKYVIMKEGDVEF